MIFTIHSFSQNQSLRSDYLYSCKYIESFKAKDSSVYDVLPNGKLIFAAYKSNFKLFKITIKDNGYYYVSKLVMRKIRRSKRKNKCKKIRINKLTKDK